MRYYLLLFSIKLLLLSPALTGFFSLLGLFLFSFLFVHGAKLILFGWLYQQNNVQKPPEPTKPPEKKEPVEEKQAPAAQEPVYYIVERKKRRAKSTYSDPKEFRFK